MSLMLSPQELEQVISKLQQLLPDREILQAYESRLACCYWSGPDKVGKNKFEGKPVDLETEIEVFHSIYAWRCGDREKTVVKYRPGCYQIWVEKKTKGAPDCIMLKSMSGVGLEKTDVNQEL